MSLPTEDSSPTLHSERGDWDVTVGPLFTLGSSIVSGLESDVGYTRGGGQEIHTGRRSHPGSRLESEYGNTTKGGEGTRSQKGFWVRERRRVRKTGVRISTT